MNFEERIYSVLVVSAAEGFNSALSALLPEVHFHPVKTVLNISSAKRAFSERSFDFVIINSPLPDSSGIRFAVDCAACRGSVVLLMVRSEFYGETYEKVVRHGVFTLQKPTSRQALEQALSWMASARERLKGFEKKTLSIEEKMEEIRIVNRAKWLLISELKMDEPEAHRYIEKQAMNLCISKRTAAENIIKTYS